MLKSLREGRLSTVDTWDVTGIFMVFVGLLFATNGIPEIYGVDLSSGGTAISDVFFHTIDLSPVGVFETSLAMAMGVFGVVLIYVTNKAIGPADFLPVDGDQNLTLEGFFGAISLSLPFVLAADWQFVADFVTTSTIGGFIVFVVGVVSATALATYPY